MKRTTMAAVLVLASAGVVGCQTKRTDSASRAERAGSRAAERAEEIREEVPIAADSLDQVMSYQISRVDPQTSEVVLVPSELAEQEIEPQAGQELRLTFGEFRLLSGKTDPSAGDVIQSLEEGGEVIIHSKRMGIPNAADDIERIEFPEQQEEAPME